MGRWLTRLAFPVTSITALLGAATPICAQPGPDRDVSRVEGRIERFTTAPRGEVDGAMLDNGTWLHWPPHLEDRFTAILKTGDRVQATGKTEAGPRGDEHFEIQAVTKLNDNATATNPDFGAAPPRGPRGRRRPPAPPERPAPPARPTVTETRTVEGTVERLTTAPRGEVDGVVLENGTRLHWPPHMHDRFTTLSKVGDRAQASGRTETGPAGDTHFEIRNLTNMGTNATAANPDFDDALRGPAAPPDRGAAPPHVEWETRLRDLERQVSDLRREIERLRREK